MSSFAVTIRPHCRSRYLTSSAARTGDIIVRFDGKPVGGIDDLHRYLIDERIGVASRLTVVRGCELLVLSVIPVES